MKFVTARRFRSSSTKVILGLLVALAGPLTAAPAAAPAAKSDKLHELRRLGKPRLVELAVARVRKDHPDFRQSEFDRIVVTVQADDIVVDFSHSIAYIPVGFSGRLSARVELIRGTVSSRSAEAKSPEAGAPERFFVWSPRARDAVRFVLAAVNRSKVVGAIPHGGLPAGTDMTIAEENDYYEVRVYSRTTNSFYKVSKASGRVYDAGHRHKVPAREAPPETIDR